MNPLPRSTPGPGARPAALGALLGALRVALLGASLGALVAGCGGGPRQTLDRISSAAATAGLAADELRARHTTARYTATTLDVLRHAVEKDSGSLSPDELPPALRGEALAAVGLAHRALGAMADAARRDDARALAVASVQVDSAGHAIDVVVAELPAR